MNCLEFRKELIALVEEHTLREDLQSALSEHGEQCGDPVCRKVWADFELLAAVVPVWQASLPQVSLENQVVKRLRQEIVDLDSTPAAGFKEDDDRQPVQQSAPVLTAKSTLTSDLASRLKDSEIQKSRSSLMAVLATVVCVTLIVPFLQLRRSPPAEIASRKLPTNATSVAVTEQLPLSPKRPVPGVVHGYARVPQSATEFVTDTMVMFIPADLSDPEDEEPSRPAQWRSRLGEQLAPVGNELGSAVDAFLDAVSKSPMRSI
ncbi:MAG: hypothetical protein R3B91_10950 [Planctomycetaceae bacterium]